jgi:hypothetical protein
MTRRISTSFPYTVVMPMILDLSAAPDDPLERLLWLSGVMEETKLELDKAYAECYFEARLTGRFDAAVGLGLHSKSTALRFCRRENSARGRAVRWADGRDPSSTAYSGD